MTRAEELVKRIVTEFKARGYEIIELTAIDAYTRERVVWAYEIERDSKTIRIEETYRHNGTSENVTARIKVFDKTDRLHGYKTLYETKIPYEASKRVINNRIDKALEKFKYSEPEPFKMEMLDSFYQ